MHLARSISYAFFPVAFTVSAFAAEDSWVGKKIMNKDADGELRMVDKNH
jgi:hypothetical protein